MDIIAVNSDGDRVGVPCKRLSKAAGPELFRAMAATVTAGRHAAAVRIDDQRARDG